MARFTVTMPQELLDRLDAYAERLRATTPGAVEGNRSLALRALLEKALDGEGPEARKGVR